VSLREWAGREPVGLDSSFAEDMRGSAIRWVFDERREKEGSSPSTSPPRSLLELGTSLFSFPKNVSEHKQILSLHLQPEDYYHSSSLMGLQPEPASHFPLEESPACPPSAFAGFKKPLSLLLFNKRSAR